MGGLFEGKVQEVFRNFQKAQQHQLIMKSYKPKLALILIAGAIVLSAPTNTASAQDDKYFEIESGRMHSTLSGIQNGKEILTWDDFGQFLMRQTMAVLEMMGFSQEQNTTLITIKNDVYNVDPKKMTGTHMKNDFMGDASTAQKQQFAEELIKKWNGKKIGEEVIAGKLCDIWDIPDMYTKIWIWKGLTLKTETNMMGNVQIVTATKLELDIDIPASTFDISKYDIKEMGGVQDIMNRY